MEDLLTIKQVGEALQVSRSKVYDFIADKENSLPVVYLSERTPRVKREELNKWIEKVRPLRLAPSATICPEPGCGGQLTGNLLDNKPDAGLVCLRCGATFTND